MVRSEYSEWFDIISSVPQGSVLGPILFLIYVNDIPETVNSNVKMVADDTKIFRTLKNKPDCEFLQADLDNLSEWNNIKICSLETDQENDLRVWISNNLKWEKQATSYGGYVFSKESIYSL